MADDIETGNGHSAEMAPVVENALQEQFEGSKSGLHRNVITMENRAYNSVLQQGMHTEIKSDEIDVLNELKTSYFEDERDRQKFLNAYAECERYGADKKWLHRLLVATNAGIKGARWAGIEETISHTSSTFNTNYVGDKKNRFAFLRGRNGNDRNPLS